jgi:HEAT repeat protein
MDKIMQFLPVNIEKMEKSKDVGGLVKTLVTHRDTTTRSKAAYALAKMKSEDALEYLVNVLENIGDPPTLREACAFSIGQYKTQEAEKLLIKAIKESSDDLRASIMQALADFNTESSTKAIVEGLNDPSHKVRNSAGASLGLTESNVVKNLYESLFGENDAVRVKAAQALGTTKNKRCIEVLSTLLNDPSEPFRKRTILTLGYFEAESIVEPLFARLAIEKGDLLTAVFSALSRVKSEKVIDLLIEGLNNKTNVGIKTACVTALCERRTARGIEALIPVLLDKKESVDLRGTIARAIGKIKGQQCLEALMATIDDESDFVRTKVEEALAEMEHPELPGKLSALCRESKESLRKSAVKIITRTKNPLTIDALALLIQDPSEDIRGSVVMALAEFNSPRVIDPLLEVLGNRSETPSIRGAAARSLGRLKEERAIPLLVEALHDESEYVRTSAASALAIFKKNEVVEALIGALGDPSEMVRLMAIESLARLRDPRAIEALKALEDDPSEKVKETIRTSLKGFGAGK